MDVEVVTSALPRWLGRQPGSSSSFVVAEVVVVATSFRELADPGAKATVIWIVEACLLERLGMQGRRPLLICLFLALCSFRVVTSCAWWAESAGS